MALYCTRTTSGVMVCMHTTVHTNAHAVADGFTHEPVDRAIGRFVAANGDDSHSRVFVWEAVWNAGSAANGAGEGN